jgi:hypothetical protein
LHIRSFTHAASLPRFTSPSRGGRFVELVENMALIDRAAKMQIDFGFCGNMGSSKSRVGCVGKYVVQEGNCSTCRLNAGLGQGVNKYALNL